MKIEDIRLKFLGEIPKRIIEGNEETYTEWLERKLIQIDKLINEKNTISKISDCSLDIIEKLSKFNISKNHTGRWGVIFGNVNRKYSFMHKEKKKVLEWIKNNYK